MSFAQRHLLWATDGVFTPLMVYLLLCICPQVIGFFSQRLEQAGADLSVERVQEVIKKGAVALPNDRLKVTHTHAHTLTCS